MRFRYDRGQRSLLDNLRTAGVVGASNTSSSAVIPSSNPAPPTTAPAGKAVSGSGVNADSDDYDDDSIPVELDDIMDILLSGLRDAATVVRWSAAKGVGRVAGRLPVDYADEVVEAVLSL